MKYFFSLLFIFLCSCGLLSSADKTNKNNFIAGKHSYIINGSLNQAEKKLKTALPYTSAAFLLADLLDLSGRPTEALKHYITVLSNVQKNGSFTDEAIASAMAIVAIRDRIANFEQIITPHLKKFTSNPGQLPAEAIFQLRNLHFAYALRTSDKKIIAKLKTQTGCLTNWITAGSFGGATWILFDNPPLLTKHGGLATQDNWPNMVSLGSGRGTSTVKSKQFKTCTISLADAAMPPEGVGFAKTTISLKQSTSMLFRLDTTAATKVYIGNTLIYKKDTRNEWTSEVSWFAANVAAGTSQITIIAANPDFAPSFSLVAINNNELNNKKQYFAVDNKLSKQTSNVAVQKADVKIQTDTFDTNAQSLYAKLKIAIWWRDRNAAENILKLLTKNGSNDSAILKLAQAEAIFIDGSIPAELAFEKSRILMKAAFSKEPRLWTSRLYLARMQTADDKHEKAIKLLTQGINICPNEPSLYFALANLTRELKWQRETELVIKKVATLLPESCKTLSWQMSIARNKNNGAKAKQLAKKILSHCDQTSTSLSGEFLRQGDFEKATDGYLAILSQLLPNKSLLAYNDVAVSSLAANMKDLYISTLYKMLKLVPTNPAIRISIADFHMANNDKNKAINILITGLALLGGPQPELRKALSALENKPIWEKFRVDGVKVINDYKNYPKKYSTSSVWVLDRAVHIINKDGSRSEIVHSIAHLITDEAVENMGEFALPYGSLLLNARTIKANGTVLIPETIKNKATISLPNLAVGDFVETEYINFFESSQVFSGGFDTGRFYFQDFDTAFHRSEMILVSPKDMKISFETRGTCPKQNIKTKSNLRVTSFRISNGLPTNPEPLSPASSEYLPSVRATFNASQKGICIKISDLLANKEKLSSQITNILNNRILKNNTIKKYQNVKLAIYKYVLKNIENNANLFDQASHILLRKSGERARIFVALLKAANINARLGFVRHAQSDETKIQIPSLDIINRVVVLVDDKDWVNMNQDGAPYGYLPPALRNRPVLFTDTCTIKQTNNGSIPIDEQIITAHFSINKNGGATGQITETLKGILAVGWRNNLKSVPTYKIENSFQEEYLGTIIPGAVITNFNVTGLANIEEPITFTYKINIPNFVSINGKKLAGTLPFGTTVTKKIGGLPSRTKPLVLASYIKKTVNITISGPPDFEFLNKSSKRKISSKWGDASQIFVSKSNFLKISSTSQLSVNRVFPNLYGNFLAFSQKLDELSTINISAELMTKPGDIVSKTEN